MKASIIPFPIILEKSCLDVTQRFESVANEEVWPNPSPLIAPQQAYLYPLESLPNIIGSAVREVVDFVQCPVVLAANSALAVVSTVVQGLADVRRAEGLEGPISINLIAVADSGERKTSVDTHFTKSIRQWETEQEEALKPEMERYEVESAAWDAEKSGLLTAIKDTSKNNKSTDELKIRLTTLESDKPIPPKDPRLLFTDATPEALAYRLAHGWPTGGILCSEGGAVLGGHAMKKESVMHNMAQLNTLWDGALLRIDRKTASSFTVRGVRLSIGLAIQADTLKTFLNSTGGLARGIGFLARFLFACPESTQGNRPFKAPPLSWQHLTRFHHRVGDILNQPLPINALGELEPEMLELSPEAKEIWIAFHDDVEAELKPGRDMAETRDVASKAADNAARLAALFHIFEENYGKNISADHMKRATAIISWHLYEARRFMGGIAIPVDTNNAVKLESWVLEYCRTYQKVEVPRTDILQKGPSCTRNKKNLDAALAELSEAGRIRETGNGRQKLIKINPIILRS